MVALLRGYSTASALAGGFVLTVAVYWSGLLGPFLFDDYPNIVNNDAIQITDISLGAFQDALSGPKAGPLGRPVSVVSFSLSHYLHGLDPFAFKATNLAIHLLNAFLLYLFLSRALPKLSPRHDRSPVLPRWLPIALVVVWMVHPINVVPIVMPVQRMTLLAATFGLSALLFHLKGTDAGGPRSAVYYLIAWAFFFPLAVLSKETALVMPLFGVVLYLACNGGVLDRHRRLAYCGLAAAAASLIVVFPHVSTWLTSAYEIRTFTLEQRLLTEARVLWFYASQILFPRFGQFGLFLDDIPISRGLLSPLSTIISLAGWGAVVCAAILYRRRSPLFFLGVFWFLAGHLLESTVVPLEIAFEHRNYLPAAGLLLAGYALLDRVRRALPVEGGRMLLPVVFLGAAAYACTLTWMRSVHFSEPLRFAMMEVEYHPVSARANLVAATSLMDAGYGFGQDFSAHAIRFHLEKSIELDRSNKSAFLYLLIWTCASGRSVDNNAILDFEQRLRSSPFSPFEADLPGRLARLAISAPACLREGDVRGLFLAGAANTLASARIRARFLEGLSDYELLVSKDPSGARNLLTKALSLQPTNSAIADKLDGYREIPGLTE